MSKNNTSNKHKQSSGVTKVTVRTIPSAPIAAKNQSHADSATGQASPSATSRAAASGRKVSAKAHTPQPSRTLMRQAVTKPAPGFKRQTTAHGLVAAAAPDLPSRISAKPSATRLNTKRLQHAHHVAKSQLISRFGSTLPATPVSHVATTPQSASPAGPKTSSYVTPRRPAPLKRPRTTADILEHALQHATSHQQTAPKHRRAHNKIFGISTLALVLLLLVGFVAIQKLPSIRLRAVASKAGFSANLPSYQPSGYHFSHLSYGLGVVALHFQSNSDTRTYDITEKVSPWDSSTLHDKYVASAQQSYQTIQSAGRTVYILGEQQATWVNGGIWYQVQSNGSLDSHQLMQLATSM